MSDRHPTAADWAALRARLDQVIAVIRGELDRRTGPSESDHAARDALRRTLASLIHAREDLDRLGALPTPHREG